MMLCPNCGTLIPKIVWSLIGGFLVVPFGIIGTVIFLIRRTLGEPPRRPPSERLLP
jgi:hypothetical protein